MTDIDDMKPSELHAKLFWMYQDFVSRVSAVEKVQEDILERLRAIEGIGREVCEVEKKLLVWMERYVHMDKRLDEIERKMREEDGDEG
jgi:hypothetical protein